VGAEPNSASILLTSRGYKPVHVLLWSLIVEKFDFLIVGGGFSIFERCSAVMSSTSSKSELSLEEEKQAWQRHSIESPLESASLPFSRKIQMLEEMEEVARAFHGGKLPPSPDEHEDRTGKLH
jgi:hypothetical protein